MSSALWSRVLSVSEALRGANYTATPERRCSSSPVEASSSVIESVISLPCINSVKLSVPRQFTRFASSCDLSIVTGDIGVGLRFRMLELFLSWRKIAVSNNVGGVKLSARTTARTRRRAPFRSCRWFATSNSLAKGSGMPNHY